MTESSTQQVVKEYKKFFFMSMVSKEFSQVPSAFVDEIWHTHINFAKCYLNSCISLSGAVFEHVPTTH